MSLQSLPQSAAARPTTFYPPEPPTRPSVPAPRAGQGTVVERLSWPSAAKRRQLLAALGGGALSPLAHPERAPRRDPVLTLVSRITQGFQLDEYERAKAMGYQAYLEEQLDHLAIDDSVMDDTLVDRFPTLQLSPKQLYDTYNANFTEPYFDFKGAMVARSVNSKRQLFERMCEFWNDHFNIDQNKGNLEWIFLPEHDRTVIRAHALGSFPQMLSACAFSAAMLFYLDNWLNVRGAPQENYARELMELHTLGVYGGYNETDVKEVAKCFTGWTLNGDASSPDWMRASFDVNLHTFGQKLVLGHVIPAAPPAAQPGQPIVRPDAQKVVDILAAHPSTAAFLARKLIRWFLTPNPPQALVDQVAATYLATNGDIKAMLRVILARQNMTFAAPALAPKFRRPFHLVVSLLRTFDGQVRDPLEALAHMNSMGHMPFDFLAPTGYSDDIEVWGNSLLPRWSFVAEMLRAFFGNFVGVSFIQWPALKVKLGYNGPLDRPGLAARMNERIFGSALPPREEDTLQQFIDTYPGVFDTHAMFDCLALGASLPGFQWY